MSSQLTLNGINELFENKILAERMESIIGSISKYYEILDTNVHEHILYNLTEIGTKTQTLFRELQRIDYASILEQNKTYWTFQYLLTTV